GDQRGEKVGSHVEERSAEDVIVALRVIHAEPDDRLRGDGFADPTAIDEGSAPLQSGAEKRVSRATDLSPVCRGFGEKFPTVLTCQCERLFREQVFAGAQDREA